MYQGRGHYAGTYMAWGVNNSGWWGEGEIKFYMDGDREFPTICGTGTEDYFCGSYNFENKETRQYQEYTTPTPAWPRYCDPIASINHRCDSACTAGISQILSGLARTYASPSRLWAGAAVDAICHCRTTLHL
ncbi:MAG: DUF2961 domain-containing protein [Pseudomonadales bacterium]|nr:DUF2961 domain-containing protein [Pseudomonadales bacterium]